MGGYWNQFIIDVADPKEAFAALLESWACDCGAAESGRGKDRYGHFDDCSAPWWQREGQKVAEFVVRHPEGSPWAREVAEQAIVTMAEDDRFSEEIDAGAITGTKFQPWHATPIGPSVTTEGVIEMPIEMRDSVSHAVRGYMAKQAWGHKYEIGDVELKATVKAIKHEPTGDVTGWCFYGRVNG